MTGPLVLYRGLTRLAAPAIIARDRGRRDPARARERLGHAGLARPGGRLVWLNAVSVGETQSALPLVRALRARGVQVLLTTTTATSATLAAARLPEGALHQFAPIDLPGPVRRFLDHWRPDAGVFVESDLWPRLILSARARGIPLALVNARLSAGSLRLWSRLPATARRLFGTLDLTRAQTPETAQALARLGARDARAVGDLKASAAPLPVDPAARAPLAQAIGARPLWLAASTHPGEEDAAAQAHAHLPGGALLIIAPRHPERGAQIADALVAQGWQVARRGAGTLPGPDTQIYVADTLGELGLLYDLAPLAFIGATLVPLGGHNPYEAQPFGTALIAGPHRSNAAAAFAPMIASGACAEVADAPALAAALPGLMAPARLARMQAAMRALPAGDPDLPDRLAAEVLGLIGG